jgi:AcrR family transcriptional regulator
MARITAKLAAMVGEAHDPALMERVVLAARRCFARFGVDRTTMDDIAKEAGIGRTGIYRLGVTRPQITHAAIVSRFRELGEQIRPLSAEEAPFPELLLRTSLATVEVARSDPELQHLLDTTETVSLHRLITGRDSIMQDIVLDVLGPMFERAREHGEIRTDISNDRAAEWLRGVYLMLILREDLDTNSEKAMISDFVVPSLTTDKSSQ